MADEINKKQPIDKEYLITSLKDLDKHILSKKYNKIISPINFRGYINTTYDGSEEVTVTFPDAELTNSSAGTPLGRLYLTWERLHRRIILYATELSIKLQIIRT